ncbi:MAG: hypothetical protein P1U49_13305 [Minwuia sp.]|nr:hypothetical protein [Minwuia sp.]
MTRLNITNGDRAAEIIRRCGVSGDVLPWRDPMHHGPFPAGHDLAALRVLRAHHLAGPHADPAAVEQDFEARDRRLAASTGRDDILLWFEHDLLDQLQILQILDWFAGAERRATALEMICIDSFPAMPGFRGIGELDAGQMASLFSLRQPVSKDALALAVSGWAAFRSADPRDLLAFLQGDLSALPLLAPTLWRHFEEYPNAASGLSRTESQLLELVGRGFRSPQDLFRQNMELETCLHIGDWRTYATANVLCRAGLLACAPDSFLPQPMSHAERHTLSKQRLSLTPTGERVVGGAQDAFHLMDRRDWLGGVEVRSAGTTWTWNPHSGELSRRKA